MDQTYQQHRLARIEGYNIARARLQSQFANGIGDLGEFEKTIVEHLTAPSARVVAWRRSEMERAGFTEGVRWAALEFYWENREAMCVAMLAQRADLT